MEHRLIKVENTLQEKGLLALAFLSDDVDASASHCQKELFMLLRRVFLTKKLNVVSILKMLFVFKYLKLKIMNTLRGLKTNAMLHFHQLNIPEEVKVGYLRFKVKRYISNPYDVSKIACVNNDAPFMKENPVGNAMISLRRCVLTAKEITLYG